MVALGLIAGDLAPSPGLELFVANDMSANQLWLPQRTGDDFQWIEAAGVRGLAVDAGAANKPAWAWLPVIPITTVISIWW